MGTFTASLRAIGDVRGLPATVELADGELRIAAGETEIGAWSLAEISLEETPTGYRMAAEGDLILIELKDIEAFAAELERRRPKRGRRRPKTEEPNPATSAVATKTRPEPKLSRTGAKRAKQRSNRAKQAAEKETKRKDRLSGSAAGGALDRLRKRFGPYLPDWVFTPAVLGVAVVSLVVMVVFPGLMSRLLLIAGALVVVGGAVAYTDPIVASRWLPGRTQPPHVLLLGVVIFLSGVLVGILARWIGI